MFTQWQLCFDKSRIAMEHLIARVRCTDWPNSPSLRYQVYPAVTANYTTPLIGEKAIFSAPFLLVLLQITTLCNLSTRPPTVSLPLFGEVGVARPLWNVAPRPIGGVSGRLLLPCKILFPSICCACFSFPLFTSLPLGLHSLAISCTV